VIRYVLIYSPPRGVEGNSVLPRDGGPKHRGPVVLRRRKSSLPPPVHQTQHHHPARAWAERHHPGVVGEPAVGWLYSVRTPRGWLGPARGEFLAPNSPLGPLPVLLTDFWATGRARNPLGFVRWVVLIKARGRYTLCPAIHRAEGARRVRNGDFWKCV
jgi:hypothetical protein